MTSNRVNNDVNEEDQNPIVNEVSDYCFISNLPDPLLHEIFYKLPIQSVSRCKCVCSSWNNFISQPSFSVNYGRKSPFTALLHRFNELPGALAPLELLLLEISENGDCVRSQFEHKVPRWAIYPSVTCIGSGNGLICMREYVIHQFDAIHVHNPILGDTIQLPRCRAILDKSRFAVYKFGFCPVANEYKVLRNVFQYSTECVVDECEICTVGVDNVWRCLTDSVTNIAFDADFVSVDGFFHWFRKGSGLITIFDLAEERFGQISAPPSLSLVSKAVNMVGIGNQLTLVDCSATQISIWKMKKHLDVDSWTEVVILTSWFPPDLQTGPSFPIPVAELRNGDMIFRCSINSLVYCNIERKRCLEIRRIGVYLFMTDFIPGYTPNFWLHASLLSRADVRPLNSENVQQE